MQAVVPAHYSVDLEAFKTACGQAVSLRLAREEELAALYPEFEVGAMPPFGMHGHRVFVERCFVGEPEMVFNAGTHTDSLCMHFGDFADVAKPRSACLA